MKISCPKNCMALQHPDAGFYIHNFEDGEGYAIESGANNHLIFLMSGSLVVNSEERRNYQVREKNMILCYKEYNYSFVADGNVQLVVAYFSSLGGACDVGLLSQLYRRQSNISYEFSSIAFTEPIHDFLDMMLRFLNDGIECKHLHYSSIQQLFVILRFYYPPKTLFKMFFNILDNDLSFKALVNNNRVKAKNLNELAALCGYDISTFNVLFRRHFKDITPYEWMQEQRSQEILHCISTTSMSIGDIAEHYGFSNSGHLSAFCRKYLGDTPCRLRAKYSRNK